MDPKEIVRRGYDDIFDRYETWDDDGDDNVRVRALQRALPSLSSRDHALDLGCGTGWLATRLLATWFEHVTAIDLSPRSIDTARARVPGVEFLVADMTIFEREPESLDLVTAFFSIIHVPAAEQPALLRRIAGWLAPGGVLVCTLSAAPGDHYDDFFGVPMFWSGREPSECVATVEGAGLRVVWAEVDTQVEHGRDVSFFWLVAQRA